MDKKDVIQIIQGYSYYSAMLAEVREQLKGISYKTTPNYGNTAAGTSGGNKSKVEQYSIKSYELHKLEAYHEKKVKEVKRLIEKSGLSEREKDVMWWLAKYGKLAAYARREGIGKDNVYKIRDRAISKIIAACITQNVV